MKPLITNLVQQFETGRLSRRDLIQGLTMLVAAGAATAGSASANAAAESAPLAPLPATGIDHVSVRVSNLERSAEFYQNLFGLKPLGEDKPHEILRLGKERVIVSLRHATPFGQIDHFGVRLEAFDKPAVTASLQKRGLTPKEDWEYGYYVRDPDGTVVQML